MSQERSLIAAGPGSRMWIDIHPLFLYAYEMACCSAGNVPINIRGVQGVPAQAGEKGVVSDSALQYAAFSRLCVPICQS